MRMESLGDLMTVYTDPLVLQELRALCSSGMSLDKWAQLANATLQWYCEDTRGTPTDERNRGEPVRILSVWLYENVVFHADFIQAYDQCSKLSNAGEKTAVSKLAQDALDVQSACNLTGVLYSFVACIDRLAGQVQRGVVERPLRRHPVVQLYADKICDLTGVKTEQAAKGVLVG